MPKLNGTNFIQKIRAINSTIPIIIISAHNDIEMLQKSINYGVQGYISKPIDMVQLSKKINDVKKEIKANSYQIIHINHPLKQFDKLLKSTPNTVVVLIKMEEFKYISSTLDNKTTKKLQKIFAKELFKYMPDNCNFSKVYLLDNGEFIFFKKNQSHIETHQLCDEVRIFQEHVNSAKIKVANIDYTLSIITSLAYGKNALENAKIGMSQLLENNEEFIVADSLFEKEKALSFKKFETFKMLKRAIDSYNIISYFQPIVNNKTQKIEKYESLVRLIDENKNIISPYFFLDTAKEGKYYQKITSIVLQNSFKALYSTNTHISINLSALDIEKKETRDEFFRLLEENKEETHRIVIELIEDETINDTKTIKAFMKKVKEFNVKIAIDDFGTGLSNFSRVLTYEPNFIKIDGSLIKDIEKSSFSQHMVETIVNFSQKQNIKTIAEYVENENIFNILCNLGVDYSQGHYFGKAEILNGS
jgi:EAL domain-containing protein (putative c-di-GMP-specific phosphodiesterase class I)/GGDEF domain-containing protein